MKLYLYYLLFHHWLTRPILLQCSGQTVCSSDCVIEEVNDSLCHQTDNMICLGWALRRVSKTNCHRVILLDMSSAGGWKPFCHSPVKLLSILHICYAGLEACPKFDLLLIGVRFSKQHHAYHSVTDDSKKNKALAAQQLNKTAVRCTLPGSSHTDDTLPSFSMPFLPLLIFVA